MARFIKAAENQANVMMLVSLISEIMNPKSRDRNRFRLNVNSLDECAIGGFQYHPIFHNQYGFNLEKDFDDEPYTYVGPCGNNARCINHEIGYTCECLVKV